MTMGINIPVYIINFIFTLPYMTVNFENIILYQSPSKKKNAETEATPPKTKQIKPIVRYIVADKCTQCVKTQKILIQNKKNIYKTKIETFDRQIQKINKILVMSQYTKSNTSQGNKYSDEEDVDDRGKEFCSDSVLDVEEKTALVNKLESIKGKRQEAMNKLDSIFKIEEDIQSLKKQQDLQQVNIKDGRTNTQMSQLNEATWFCQNKNIENRIKQYKPSPIQHQIQTKSRTQSMQLPHQPTTYKIQASRHPFKQAPQQNSSTVQVGSSGKKRKSQPDIYKSSSLNRYKIQKCDRSAHKNQYKNGDYYLIEDCTRGLREEVRLWSHSQKGRECRERRDDRDERDNRDDRDGSYMQEFSEEKGSYEGDTKHIMMKKTLKNITSTPISITKKQEKLTNTKKQQKQISNFNINSQLIRQQYLVLCQQVNNIIQTLNSIPPTTQHPSSCPITPCIQPTFPNLHKCLQNLHKCFQTHTHTLHNKIQSLQQQLQNQNQKQYQKQQKQYQKQQKQYQNEKKQKQVKMRVMQLQAEKEVVEGQLNRVRDQLGDFVKRVALMQDEFLKVKEEKQDMELAKKQIQNNMADVLYMYTQDLSTLQKQLQEVCESISLTERGQYSERFSFKPQKSSSQNSPNFQQICTKISKMLQLLKSTCQSQKVSILQNKQLQLSLQYQLSVLKSQQQRLAQKQKHLLSTLQSHKNSLTSLSQTQSQKQIQKNNLLKIISQLKQEQQQYQNLLVIKKQAYKELQNKYTSFKTKKTKIQKTIDKMEAAVRDLDNKGKGIEDYISKREKNLEDVNTDIRSKLTKKDQLDRQIKGIQDSVRDKEVKLSKLDVSIDKRQDELKKIEKQVKKAQQHLQQLTQTLQSTTKSLQKQSQSLRNMQLQTKQAQQKHCQLQSQLASLTQNICQNQQKYKSLQISLSDIESKIKKSNNYKQELIRDVEQIKSQLKGLGQVKDQLEDGVRGLLDKKEEAVGYLGIKYQELQKMQQQLEHMKECLAQTQHQHTETQSELNNLTQTLTSQTKSCQSLTYTLKSLSQQLQQVNLQLLQHREQQQNIQQRLSLLQQTQQKLLLEIATLAYTENIPYIKQCNIGALLPIQLKERIEKLLEELRQGNQLKAMYEKEKQANRKLRLDCDRWKKMWETQNQPFVTETEGEVIGEEDVIVA